MSDEQSRQHQDLSALELLQHQALAGQLSRRSVLKRAMLLGLSAPVITGLLAACGDDDDDDGGDATAPGGTDQEDATEPAEATEAEAEATEPEGAATESGAATAPAEGTTDTGTGTAPAPKPGHGRGVADLLRILYWQAPTNLNPHFSQGTKDSAAASIILEPLIDILEDGTIIPVLAAEAPSLENGGVAEDGLSVTYKLKEGVVWSDGEPFTAEDVKFTWEFATDEAAATVTIATYQPISDVEVIDDVTVKLNFAEPTPGWFNIFATGFGGQVIPKHIMQDFMGAEARNAPFNLDPVGTGPYKVIEFRPGDVINLEINENYREADKPYFQTVEWKGGGDATSAARAALQTGETDWGWNLQVEKAVLDELANSDTGVLQSNPSSSVERILVNFADPNTEVDGARSEPSTQHPFLQFPEVREAFAMGCDRETIASQLYGAAGAPTSNLITSPSRYASPNTSFTFDVEAASQMLEDAGWTGSPRAKDGVEMSVLYQTSINPVRQKTQEIVKAAWEEMGIPTELKSIDASVYFSSDAGNPDTASHFYADFEMYTNGPTTPFPLPYLLSWRSADPAVDLAQQSNQWAGTNTVRWVNSEFNDLYAQALTELDPDTQTELFISMNDLVVNNYVEIPLVARTNVVGSNAKLKGFVPSPWTPDVRDIAEWYFEE
jgi:peptide/nickel transport system substrate-binding protein